MTTIYQSATQPNTAIEKREASAYYKTLVSSGYAPVNGLQMYYEIHGTVSARPLVTIHPAWGLANVFPQLSRNRQLIAVELQGHGRTADIERPLTYEQEADDVAALVKHLQIEQADFFGESIGGIVAVMMAVRHPELVRRVVTYESALMKVGDVTALKASADVVSSRTPDDYSVQFQRESYQRVAPDPTGWPTLFDKVSRKTIEWQGFSRDELKSITAPVLIATGDHPNLGDLLEHMLEVFQLIPNAQLAVIPDAGHFVLNDDPEKLLPIVATFLDQPTSTVPFATPTTGYHPGVTR
jgi:pimeloyl-ACP methyl ester carboxylesterase